MKEPLKSETVQPKEEESKNNGKMSKMDDDVFQLIEQGINTQKINESEEVKTE